VARFDHVQVSCDDDQVAELGQEARQRRGHCVLEGALVLVAVLLRAAGGHIQLQQPDGMAAGRHGCGQVR
jgi:hypothetical protein